MDSRCCQPESVHLRQWCVHWPVHYFCHLFPFLIQGRASSRLWAWPCWHLCVIFLSLPPSSFFPSLHLSVLFFRSVRERDKQLLSLSLCVASFADAVRRCFRDDRRAAADYSPVRAPPRPLTRPPLHPTTPPPTHPSHTGARKWAKQKRSNCFDRHVVVEKNKDFRTDRLGMKRHKGGSNANL